MFFDARNLSRVPDQFISYLSEILMAWCMKVENVGHTTLFSRYSSKSDESDNTFIACSDLAKTTICQKCQFQGSKF